MAARCRWSSVLGFALGLAPVVACAEPPAGARLLLDALQAGQSRLHELLARHFAPVGREHPEWLLEQSQDDVDPVASPGSDAAQLVLQQDRRDGAELLTVRHPLFARGALRAYAGAGINRTTYFASPQWEPMWLARRNRHEAYGAAAEVGAEFRLGGQLMVSADMRWADLEGRAELLRTEDGPVVADPLTLGLTVGWRFR